MHGVGCKSCDCRLHSLVCVFCKPKLLHTTLDKENVLLDVRLINVLLSLNSWTFFVYFVKRETVMRSPSKAF